METCIVLEGLMSLTQVSNLIRKCSSDILLSSEKGRSSELNDEDGRLLLEQLTIGFVEKIFWDKHRKYSFSRQRFEL